MGLSLARLRQIGSFRESEEKRREAGVQEMSVIIWGGHKLLVPCCEGAVKHGSASALLEADKHTVSASW